MPEVRSAKRNAHLVWSQGFAQSLLSSLATLSFAAYACSTSDTIRSSLVDLEEMIRFAMLKEAHRWALWGVLSLLSSSCCLIQILLSTFSVGCAGLNLWIGPWRPHLLALTLALQAATWRAALSSPVFLWKQCVAATFLSIGHSFLPEILYLFAAVRGSAGSYAKNSDGDCDSETTLVSLQLSNLGCTACMTAVTGVAMGHKPFVRRILELDIAEGRACIEVCGLHTNDDRPEQLRTLTADLDAAGFPAEIVDVGGTLTSDRRYVPLTAKGGKTTAKVAGGVEVADKGETDKVAIPLWCDLASAASCLLASSCCVLQLGLNVLSTFDVVHVGCLGLNKTLGPLRPLTRALTLTWLAALWVWTVRLALANRRRPMKNGSNKPAGSDSWVRVLAPLVLRTALTVFLAWLPELLLLVGGPGLAPPTGDTETIRFRVEGMGCEACLSHVNGLLAHAGGVVSGGVADLDEGVAELLVAKGWHFDAQELGRRLSVAGFELVQSSGGVVSDSGGFESAAV